MRNGDDRIKTPDVSVIVPSLNPDENLICVVDGLISAGFTDIILVNDGSLPDRLHFFDEAASHPECTVLSHEVNRGKGAALKTAFAYVLSERPDSIGVVTADGDNQHTPEDILSCAREMEAKKDHVILGARDFSLSHVPAKSRMGNRITSFVFKVACGLDISDTQTGLRAIPRSCLECFLAIEGDRFEYETNMLLAMKKNGIPFTEVKIKTVYIEKNASSHFNPIVDSIKIYKTLFKYIASSFSSFLIDILAFFILSLIFTSAGEEGRVVLCTVIARAISSLFNFFANKIAVFKNKSGILVTFLKYYALCIPQMLVSAYAVKGVSLLFSASAPALVTLIKIVIDTVLFFLSYQIQKRWVFKSKGA